MPRKKSYIKTQLPIWLSKELWAWIKGLMSQRGDKNESQTVNALLRKVKENEEGRLNRTR